MKFEGGNESKNLRRYKLYASCPGREIDEILPVKLNDRDFVSKKKKKSSRCYIFIFF